MIVDGDLFIYFVIRVFLLQLGETEVQKGEVSCSDVVCGSTKNRREVAQVFLHPFITAVLV